MIGLGRFSKTLPPLLSITHFAITFPSFCHHFACKVVTMCVRPSSLIALLAMRYRGKDTSLPSVKDTLLSKSEGKGRVMRGVIIETLISSVFDTILIANVLASKLESSSFDASTLASHL